MTSKTAIAVLVVVGLTAAGTAAVLLRKPDPPPTIALQPCEVANVSAQCGTLEVFEDRGSRRGRKIGIKVVVLRALGQATAEPIFWLEGGPGGAATSAARADRIRSTAPTSANRRTTSMLSSAGSFRRT